MKKIAFIIEDLSSKGGRETVLSILANALCANYEVHVCCVTQKNATLAYNLDPSIHYQAFTYYEGRIRERYMRSVGKIRRYVQKEKIDVVLGIGSSTFIICALVTLFSNVKFIGCEHSNLKNTYYDPLERLSQKIGAYTTHRLVTLTKKDKANWIDQYPFVKKKIDYSYNPIEHKDYFEPYRLDSKKIVSIGRITKVKQFHLIPSIASLVFTKHPDWTWDIYGEGDETYIDVVKEEIKKYHLENHVFLKGNHPNPHAIYNDYAFYVLTSEFEGLPVVLLEAKQHQLPIVAFDCQTGPSDIIDHQINGLLVSQNDLEGMAKAINTLIESQELRAAYASHAKDNLGLFEKQTIIEWWKKQIEEVTKCQK